MPRSDQPSPARRPSAARRWPQRSALSGVLWLSRRRRSTAPSLHGRMPDHPTPGPTPDAAAPVTAGGCQTAGTTARQQRGTVAVHGTAGSNEGGAARQAEGTTRRPDHAAEADDCAGRRERDLTHLGDTRAAARRGKPQRGGVQTAEGAVEAQSRRAAETHSHCSRRAQEVTRHNAPVPFSDLAVTRREGRRDARGQTDALLHCYSSSSETRDEDGCQVCSEWDTSNGLTFVSSVQLGK